MNLNQLSDTALDKELESLFKSEREILTQTLHHLREAERRRLFSAFGYKSLFEYAVQRFSLTEDEAYRRISAMRLLRELPQIEEKIDSGKLSLTNLAQAQTLFRREAKENRGRSASEKAALLLSLESCTKAQAANVIQSELPSAPKSELKEYYFLADKDFQAKIERLSEILGEADIARILERACETALQHKDPIQKAKRAQEKQSAVVNSVPDQKSRVNKLEQRKRYIPAAIRHSVFLRDNGRCQNCASTRHIEVDHVAPYERVELTN